MATVTGFTAERMLNIENSTVVDGEVQGDNLILQTRDGTPIDAGSVRGPKGDTGDVGPASVHPGIISMYGGDSAPAGYLLCDGALVSRVTYATLFAEIGTIWGAGDGLNTFNVPNLQQRFPVGKGTQPWATPIGKADGSKDAAVVQHQHDIGHSHNTSNHKHGIDHGHTASAGFEDRDHYHGTPNHSHYALWNGGGIPYRSVVGVGQGGGYDIINLTGGSDNNVALSWTDTPATTNSGGSNTGYQVGRNSGTRDAHSHAITVLGTSGAVSTDAGAQTLSHTGNAPNPTGSVPGTDKNLPPYVVVNFIIKT